MENRKPLDLPDLEYCFDLMTKMGMMSHIIDHSVMVKNVANCLCRHLKPVYPQLNTDLVQVSALLHDITKTRSFTTGERHDDSGGRLLTSLGYKEVGNIIRQHVVLDEYHNNKDFVTEAEIVNYADKRVLHHEVVTLFKRLEYILDKYGTTKEFCIRIKTMWKNSQGLQEKLFKHIDITPDLISELVREIPVQN